jgi:hypothetical protein
VYTPDATQCDDGNLCTANTCDAVKGCTYAASAAACDDKNPCTDDTCDPIKGCTNAANSANCDDADACTTSDTCLAKACVGGPAKNCEDGIACTAHSCDKASGCKQTADAKKCDDGKPCTADTCDVAKGCTYAADAKVCDDANVCTDDSCDNAKGCANVANVAVCNDGNACTLADACVGGTCKGGPALVCDDLKECTSDSCDPASGCKVANKPNSASCTPATSCSATATCGGDGNCYDGPSKYWVKHVTDTSGQGFGAASLSVPSDGGGPVYLYHNDGQQKAIFVRMNIFGQDQFQADMNDRRMTAVRCSPWNANECVVVGRSYSQPTHPVAEMRSTSNGNKNGQYEIDLGGHFAEFTNATFQNGGLTFLSANRYIGPNSDAYMYNYSGQQLWKYEGPGDDRTTAVHYDKDGVIVFGYTNSKGGTGYNAFAIREGYNNDVVTTDNGGNEYFYSFVTVGSEIWGIGTTDAGGSTKVMAVRVEGGSKVIKTYDSLGGGGHVGAISYGANVFLAGPSSTGKLAALNSNMEIVWQTNYSVSPINTGIGSVFATSAGLVFGGSGFNGQTGKTSIVMGRTGFDGVANCTDKNPCAALLPGACDDKISCTADSCDTKSGCLHQPVDAACNDGNPCTLNSCDEKKGCVYPQNPNAPCNDNNACTLDTCDIGAAKCVYTLNVAKACDDANPCTNEVCANNNCEHETTNCDDGKVCSTEVCDPVKGCTYTYLDGKPCEDGNPCTIFEVCGTGALGYGKCQAAAEVCTQAVVPVLHTHASVAGTIQATGGKIDAWTDVQKPSGFWSPYTSKPVIAKGAVFGRDGIDMSSSGMRYGWNNSGSWTAAFVFRSGGGEAPGTLFTVGAWRGLLYQGKLMLNTKGSLDVASVPVEANKSYVVIVRMGLGEGKLLAFSGGAPKISAGVVPSQPAGNFEISLNRYYSQADDANPVFGEVLLYDKALSDSEVTALATQLQTQWGLAGCQAHSDCDDANACTNDFCQQFPDKPKECTHDALTNPSAGSCKDNNPCTIEEACDKGQCVGSKPAPCDDGKPCTKDYCDPNKGCLVTTDDNSLKCDDGSACTYEFCSAGNCVVGAVTCDDKNGCTADSCDKATGCVFTATTAPCDDGNVCTSNDACANKSCAGTNNTATCDDYHPCTTNEKCKDGSCSDTKPVVCPDDGNACTLEECSYWGGCKVNGIKTCSDGNPCTDDSCNVGTGQCEFAANTVACSDGELCTLGDFCSGKKCNSGKLNECEDGDICTADSCVAGTGCKHEVVTTCEDGNLCTVDDLCVFGSCLAGGAKNCDDANACTSDYCIAPGGGCGHDALVDGAPCDDGVLCTLPDTCQAGSCKVGPKVCDYAVTSLGDGEFQSPKDGLWYPDHGTLREAIFDAQFKPAGAFKVRFFVAGKLTLTKPMISLAGDWTLDSAGQTILVDGAGAYQALYVHSGTTTIKGLKFQNTYVDKKSTVAAGWPATQGSGGAIVVKTQPGAATPTKLILENCEFYNGKSEYGGGAIYAVDAEVVVSGGQITKCSRTTGMGTTLANGSIAYGDGGGAVRVEGSKAKFTASDMRFDYNSGPGPGSGLWCGPGSACALNRVSFFGGLAHSGAVGVAQGASAVLTNVTITANEGYGIGTGLYSQGNLTLRHVTISGNSAANEQTMPALYVNGPTILENTIVSEAGGSATGLDCVRGPKGTVTAVNSLITKTAKMPADWGTDGGGLTCVAQTQPPANLKGQKLVGNVRVMYPYPSSPAVDKGNLQACMAPSVGGKDVTGAPRPQGNGCDMGSAELQP